MRPVTKTLFPQLAHVLYDVRVIPYGYVQLENVWALKSYLPLAILGLVCLCILLSLLYLFSDLRTFLFAALVLFAGLMSRIVIGFTPSAWGSGVRAFFFMYVSLIIVILLVFQELLRLDKKHFPQNVLIFTALYTGLTVLNGYLLHG
ncbi:hypothetical protein NBRC111894_3491 [Sporolactobacillus inulinus]|uniref:Uncharacterized protein n=1 Tax=Sporolactobacillus inulinus TaxID=2078 RepID=A0A4Y1ZFL2_9BACL|nr:hypothetical protein [Sporolactobacillus inulinus]GAY77937.1 hypothetical protein NBRC111894_3491 [Sporolactobacillus inulinus]